MSDSNLL